MREDVLIILNEREPLKQQKASELHEQLTQRGLSAVRLKPTSTIDRVIEERAPRLLVIDYLLGDYGTALDVLHAMATRGATEQTQIILWTDEPSVGVAVSAMKLGARDFIETGSARSVDKVVAAVEECMREQRVTAAPARARSRAGEALVYHAPASRPCLIQTEAAAVAQIVVLQGPLGVGRSALARYLHRKRSRPGALIELDVDTWTGQTVELFGDRNYRRGTPLLSHAATVMLDHMEFDTGELLEAVAKTRKEIFGGARDNPVLVVGTTDPETARAWVRLVDAALIVIPPLAERPEDFLPLLQRIQLDLGSLVKNELELTSECVGALQAMPWPGNIRQLRAVLAEVLSARLEGDGKNGDGDRAKRGLAQLLEAVQSSRERWERYHTLDSYVPTPIKCRAAIEAANGNLRIAAARLGTGVPQLRSALSQGGGSARRA